MWAINDCKSYESAEMSQLNLCKHWVTNFQQVKLNYEYWVSEYNFRIIIYT